MHAAFLRLFFSSRALGSNFWLSTGIFMSSVMAFLFTLPLCAPLNIPLDPICLSEALPFLVCTVGFEKPLRLAREVMKHEHLLTPVQGAAGPQAMKPAGHIVLEALDRTGNSIVRDYALEIAVLLVGAYSRVGGLKEFCALAAVAMVLDCIMLSSFYTAVLTIMVEVRRIKTVRALKKSQDSSPPSPTIKPALVRSGSAMAAAAAAVAIPEARKSTGLSERLLGTKGSLLTDGKRASEFDENPMSRLKLLVVRYNSSFIVTCSKNALPARVVLDPSHPQLLHHSHPRDRDRPPPQER